MDLIEAITAMLYKKVKTKKESFKHIENLQVLQRSLDEDNFNYL